MIRRVVAGGAGLIGLCLLLVGLVQALNGLSWFFTVSGGLLLLAAAGGLLVLATLAPAASDPPPVPRPVNPAPRLASPSVPLADRLTTLLPSITDPAASVDPRRPAGHRPGSIQIALPSRILTFYPDDPDAQILIVIRALTPADFEHFCRVLLEAMGYEQVRVQGKTGDEGVDLTMRHNGVLVIAQCKRYSGNVGAPALRDFYGTLMHTHAAHGFFITTSGFTGAAQDWAAGKPIQLVTGAHLVTAVRRYLL